MELCLEGKILRNFFHFFFIFFFFIFLIIFCSSVGQQRAAINTVISLTASCIIAFFSSQFIRNERVFYMVDIQNATLAGGVAMGTAANMVHHPAIAILIGGLSGFVR